MLSWRCCPVPSLLSSCASEKERERESDRSHLRFPIDFSASIQHNCLSMNFTKLKCQKYVPIKEKWCCRLVCCWYCKGRGHSQLENCKHTSHQASTNAISIKLQMRTSQLCRPVAVKLQLTADFSMWWEGSLRPGHSALTRYCATSIVWCKM